MTSRERVMRALNFEEPDRVPIDFWATPGFYRLVEKTDVLIEGNRPGTLKRRGMDYETVKGLNPRLVYCSVTGYGQDGPYAQRPGHDINFVGVAGILGLSGSKQGPPCYTVTPMIADVLGGTTQAAMAIMAALFARERTGRGQYIDASSVDGAVFYHWVHAPQYFCQGIVPERSELPTGIDVAYMNIYKAAGRLFVVLRARRSSFPINSVQSRGRRRYMTPSPRFSRLATGMNGSNSSRRLTSALRQSMTSLRRSLILTSIIARQQ